MKSAESYINHHHSCVLRSDYKHERVFSNAKRLQNLLKEMKLISKCRFYDVENMIESDFDFEREREFQLKRQKEKERLLYRNDKSGASTAKSMRSSSVASINSGYHNSSKSISSLPAVISPISKKRKSSFAINEPTQTQRPMTMSKLKFNSKDLFNNDLSFQCRNSCSKLEFLRLGGLSMTNFANFKSK